MKMLSSELTIEDVMKRGIVSDNLDGTEEGIMDSRCHFAIFKTKHGISKEVIRGPFTPDDQSEALPPARQPKISAAD